MFSLCSLGSGASFPHAQVGRLYSLPSVVCVSFPGDLVVQDGLLFSPCRELCVLICLGPVEIFLGVVFPIKLQQPIYCMCAMVGLWTVLGAGMGAWFA